MEDFCLVVLSLQSHPDGSEAAFEANKCHLFCKVRKQVGENNEAIRELPQARPWCSRSASSIPRGQSLPSDIKLWPSRVSSQPSWCWDLVSFCMGFVGITLERHVYLSRVKALYVIGETCTAGDKGVGEGRVLVGPLPAF